MILNDFIQKREKWLDEVAEQFHQFATDKEYGIDKDFYVFQTNSDIHNADILIIGINPGGDKPYSQALKEKGISRRTGKDLGYSENLLVKAADWGDGMEHIRKNFRMVFHNDELFRKLENSIMMNIIFMNTKNSNQAYSITKKITEYSKKKTKEFIDICEPKNIVFLTTDKKKVGSFGVKNIKALGDGVFTGDLNNRTVLMIPHYAARPPYRYSIDFCKKMGDKLQNVLK